ncbi:MAG: ABC transporter permease [Caldiserica bacterium]|nr:ABC transporter permease [Caldisericota bacterium]
MRALVVAEWEFTNTVRRKEFILSTLLVPLFALAVFSLPVWIVGKAAPSHVAAGYVDHTGRFELPESLKEEPAPGRKVTYSFIRYPSEEAARHELLEGRLNMYLVIPEDYLRTGELRFYVRSGAQAPGGAVQRVLVRQLLEGRVDDATLERVSRPAVVKVYRVRQGGEVEAMDLMSTLSPLFLGVILMMGLVISSGLLMHSMTEEKSSRVVEVLLHSVPAETLLAGKVLGLGAAGFLQLSAWLMLLFPLVATATVTAEPVTLLLAPVYFILGFLLYATIIAGIGAVSTSPREAQQFTGILVVFLSLPLLFGPFILSSPDAGISRALSLFPLTSPVAILYRSTITDVSAVDYLLSMLLLLASSVAMLKLSGRLLRTSMLMRGKSLTEVLHALWQRR